MSTEKYDTDIENSPAPMDDRWWESRMMPERDKMTNGPSYQVTETDRDEIEEVLRASPRGTELGWARGLKDVTHEGLLRCPSCEAANVTMRRWFDARRWVRCRICDLQGPMRFTCEEAASDWNALPRRTEMSERQAEIERRIDETRDSILQGVRGVRRRRES